MSQQPMPNCYNGYMVNNKNMKLPYFYVNLPRGERECDGGRCVRDAPQGQRQHTTKQQIDVSCIMYWTNQETVCVAM